MTFVPFLLLPLLLSDPFEPARPMSPDDMPATASVMNDRDQQVIVEGEDLLYEVRWSVFKLGTIRFKTLKNVRHGTTECAAAIAYMDSYDGVPFVNLHATTYTEIDSQFVSCGAQSMEKKDDRWWVLRYVVDRSAGRVYVDESWRTEPDVPAEPWKQLDTLTVDARKIEDSFSLALYARAHVRSSESVKLPLMLYGKLGNAYLDFTDEVTTQEIDAVNYPVRVVPLRGHLDIEGLFGLSGDFEGWFSDDEARVPIKAKLNVLIGSITVELKEWSRKGWSPPRNN